MVAVQLVFRGWAIGSAWFYGDDFEYLRVAREHDFDLDYLLLPHGGHLLPVTRILADLLAQEPNALNWQWAALSIILMQGAASLAALWAMVTLFGRRWGILAPLALFLTSAVTLPATLWWAASMNQLGHQAGLFLAVGAWVRFERTRRVTSFLLVVAGVAISFLCDARGLFIAPLLAMLSVGWFATGGILGRITQVLRRNWWAALTLVAIAAGYWVYYSRNTTEALLTTSEPGLAGDLASVMIGDAFATGILGGPWRWNTQFPPTSLADAPTWMGHLAWVVIVMVMLYAWLTRRRAMRAFTMIGIYVLALYAMVLVSRATVIGAALGAEYRYLTDAVAVVALGLGLAFLHLPGASESSVPRTVPLIGVLVRPVHVIVLVALVAGSGLWSSWTYAKNFSELNRGRAFSEHYASQVAAVAPVDLAPGDVPDSAISKLVWPEEALQRLTDLLGAPARFPETSRRLGVVTEDGSIHTALIDAGVTNTPGPAPDCGWRIEDGSLRVPLTGEAFPWTWWMRIGYLSGSDSQVTIRAGSTTVHTEIKKGLHSLYVKTQGGFDNVYIGGLDEDVTMCVDRIEVGKVVPGGPLA